MRARGLHRSVLAALVAVCALTGGLAFASAPALAAAPEVSEVTVESPVPATSAKLSGVLNAAAKSPVEAGSYEFLYAKGNAGCTGGSKEPVPPGLMTGVEDQSVSQLLSGLSPATEYTVCLRAVNDASEEAVGPAVAFTTGIAAPTITNESPAKVEETAATLEAEIDPDGVETTYHFEYGTSETSSQSLPTSTLGADGLEHNVSARITGLEPGATYHYRVVVSSSLSPAGGTLGPDESFTTPAAPGSAAAQSCSNELLRAEQPYGLGLPDCRAYEMVSPVEKGGNDATDAGETKAASRASVSGDAIVFTSHGSFADPAGGQYENQYLSQRGPEGWSTQAITPPFNEYNLAPKQSPYETMVFTPELTKGIANTDASLETNEANEAPMGQFEMYEADFANSTYQWISNAPIGTEENDLPYHSSIRWHTMFEPMGASTDLSHVVFVDAAGGEAFNFAQYEWIDGKVIGVSVNNNDELFNDTSTGYDPTPPYYGTVPTEVDVWNAVSSNGSRVFFTTGGQLYVRKNTESPQSPVNGGGECTVSSDACTIKVSASQKTDGSGPNGTDVNQGTARYWGASTDGSKVFFTSAGELTNDANTGISDKQEILVQNASGGTFTLTFEGQTTSPMSYAATNGEIQSALEGLSSIGTGNVTVSPSSFGIGEANRGPIVTFDGPLAGSEQPLMTANSSLNEGAAVAVNRLARPGDDLYEYDLEDGKLTDLTVDNTDVDGAAVQGVLQVSEDGSYVYFVAQGKLAGNAVAGVDNLYVSHEGGAPVFIATLAADDDVDWTLSRSDTSSLSEAGTRLAFVSDQSLTGYDNEQAEPGECLEYGKGSGRCNEVYLFDASDGNLTCASCDQSGARPTGPSSLGEEYDSDPEHRRRNFSEDGSRLFFQSTDALVPHASDGRRNVYEYEDGHVYAISDVAGAYESFFLDASASGNDVFFGTADQLLPQDQDKSIDVYDARVGGGFPVVVSPPPCDNGDSCKPPPAPQSAIFGAPGSATFSGAGNIAPAPVAKPAVKAKGKPVKCKKGYRRSKGKCVKAAKAKSKAKKSTHGKGSN
jgi:hypothetical protein